MTEKFPANLWRRLNAGCLRITALMMRRPHACGGTVTPAALPQQAARRRVDPMQRKAEAKGGTEGAEEHARAAFAAMQALRHAGVSAQSLAMRVQREPFEAKGERAEAFAPGTRFAKERLWHVEIDFAEAISGPLFRRRTLSRPRPDGAGS